MANEPFTNITIANATYSVTIDVLRDEEIITKKLAKITPPTSTNNYSAGSKDTKMVDLLQIETRISIDGILSTDSTSTSSKKRNDLRKLLKAGGVLAVIYEDEGITANFEKLQIDKIVADGTEPSANEAGYTVKFTLLIGVNF